MTCAGACAGVGEPPATHGLWRRVGLENKSAEGILDTPDNTPQCTSMPPSDATTSLTVRATLTTCWRHTRGVASMQTVACVITARAHTHDEDAFGRRTPTVGAATDGLSDSGKALYSAKHLPHIQLN